ncbi:uncharacterized protein SCHCODRAFT_0109453, partial [Schizophyllum commune H4-8]
RRSPTRSSSSFASATYLRHQYAHSTYLRHQYAHSTYLRHQYAHSTYLRHQYAHSAASHSLPRAAARLRSSRQREVGRGGEGWWGEVTRGRAATTEGEKGSIFRRSRSSGIR